MSEAALAERLRQSIRSAPNDPQLIAPDNSGRTPLMQAALYGYADIVDALLTSPRVRADLEHRDAFGATAWQLAQFARPLTLLTCHSLYLATEMEPLWRAQQWRAGYFQRGQETAFHAISRSLLAAGATTDTDGARTAWRRHCPEREELVDKAVDTAPDLLKALLSLQTTRAERWDQRWITPLVAPPGTVLRISLPLPLPGNSTRVPSGEQVCSHLPSPELPAVNWAGRVVLRTTGRLEAGRVIVSATGVVEATNGVDRPTLRRLRLAINQALAQYRCRGDHLFEREFTFMVE